MDAVGTERSVVAKSKPARIRTRGDRAYAAAGSETQRIPATPLVAQLVPRDLTDRRVLRAGAREVDDYEFLALAAGLGAVADLADLGVDVRLGHRAVGDRRPQLADLGRLLREVADVANLLKLCDACGFYELAVDDATRASRRWQLAREMVCWPRAKRAKKLWLAGFV